MNSLLLASVGNIILYVAIGVLALIIAVVLILVPIKTWFIALVSGAHVSMTRLIGMKMRRIPVAVASAVAVGFSRFIIHTAGAVACAVAEFTGGKNDVFNSVFYNKYSFCFLGCTLLNRSAYPC